MNDSPEQSMVVSEMEFASAKRLFQETGEVSTALLQRRFKLAYPDAEDLMARFEVAGLVTSPLPEGFRVLTPKYSNHPGPHAPNDIEQHARRVFETAVHLLELKTSNGGGGHSEAWKEIKPNNYTDWKACRLLFSQISDSLGGTPEEIQHQCIEACRSVAEFVGTGCTTPPYTFAQIDALLQEKCAWWASHVRVKREAESMVDFGYAVGLLAAARYLYRIYLEGAEMGGGHSRLEHFVRQDLRDAGTSRAWQNEAATVENMRKLQQDEHVVPCVFIRDNCIRLFGLGASIAQIAEYIGRHMVIVKLLKTESGMLDATTAKGGYGLKTRMPEGWRVGIDSIFARLHEAEIEFTPPSWFRDNVPAIPES